MVLDVYFLICCVNRGLIWFLIFFQRRRRDEERTLQRQEFQLRDLRKAVTIEPDLNKQSSMLELEQETVVSKIAGMIDQ